MISSVLCKTCAIAIKAWRACPFNDCNFVAAYCMTHGGDDQALLDMISHLSETHGQEPPKHAA